MLEEINQKLQELHLMQIDIDNAEKKYIDYKNLLESALGALGFYIDKCNECHGTGQVIFHEVIYQDTQSYIKTCPVCKGSTYRVYKKTV